MTNSNNENVESLDPDYQDILSYLAYQNPTVRKNVSIVSAKDLGTDTLLHFTTNGNIKKFEPRVSQKTMPSEDRSLPRISVSTYLVGCIAGYAIMETDYFSNISKEYRGGWYLYEIPFTYALKPNKTIQPDVDATNEHYLVPYNKKQWKVIPNLVAKLFVERVIHSREGKDLKSIWCIYIDIFKEEGFIYLSPTVKASKGQWSFLVEGVGYDFFQNYKDFNYKIPTVSELKKLPTGVYDKAKNLRAEMLDYRTTVEEFFIELNFKSSNYNLERLISLEKDSAFVTRIVYKPIPYPLNKDFYEIPGYSLYAASANGEIFNKKFKKSTLGGSDGKYRRVSVYPDNFSKAKLVYVHDLVCRAFYGLPNGNMVVMHLDNNKLNNQASNLRWGTQSENIQQAWDDGLINNSSSR